MFERGMRHGYGLWKGDDSTEYAGEWMNDFRHGQGRQEWKDSSSFEGKWQKNQMVFGVF